MKVRTWILVPILVAGCAGGSDDEREADKPGRQAAPAEQQALEDKAAEEDRAKDRARARGHKRAEKPKTKPQRRSRALPWHESGMSRVAHVETRLIRVYASPKAKRPTLVLRKRDHRGTPRTFLVKDVRKKWVRVYLPTRPNGSQGWVRKRAVKLYTNGYRLVVRLKSRKLNVWRGTRMLASYKVGIGTTSTPTPRGMFYVIELLKPRSPHGAYGPYAFGLSAHSNVHMSFAGGDGRVGLHGTNQPGLIGSAVSNGCIRLKNHAIRKLAGKLPLGTPIHIRS
jgi:lipoprotein-anchoring transpeptidase ErfK/SrfK